MTTARRTTLVALALLGFTLQGAAQTVSQRCVSSVRETFPDEATVWVVAANTVDDHTELRWQSATGREGICRLESNGRISDVSITGYRTPTQTKVPEPEAGTGAFEPYELSCESEHGSRTECEIRPSALVLMVEQLGEDDCIAGLTWGEDGDALWVDRGCRAVFRISPRPARIEPSSLRDQGQGGRKAGEGVSHPAFQETRARQQCRDLAASLYASVIRFLGTRIEGHTVLVLMEVQSVSQRQEVTCRYDPATDQALIAR